MTKNSCRTTLQCSSSYSFCRCLSSIRSLACWRCTVDMVSIFYYSTRLRIRFWSFSISSFNCILSYLCSNLISLSLLCCDIHLNFSFCSSIIMGSLSIFTGGRVVIACGFLLFYFGIRGGRSFFLGFDFMRIIKSRTSSMP